MGLSPPIYICELSSGDGWQKVLRSAGLTLTEVTAEINAPKDLILPEGEVLVFDISLGKGEMRCAVKSEDSQHVRIASGLLNGRRESKVLAAFVERIAASKSSRRTTDTGSTRYLASGIHSLCLRGIPLDANETSKRRGTPPDFLCAGKVDRINFAAFASNMDPEQSRSYFAVEADCEIDFDDCVRKLGITYSGNPIFKLPSNGIWTFWR